MTANLIFLPAFAMAALTALVWWHMYTLRIGEMKRERIHPQAVALSSQMATLVKDTRAADNFRNLFELPVLFYVALLIAYVTAQVSVATLGLAWAFVVLRYAHSYIHCTYNKVFHRFQVYVTGGLVLWALWAVLAVGIL